MSERQFSLAELAEVVQGEVLGNPDCQISGLAPLADAGAGDLSYLAHKKYQKHLSTTQATAVLLAQESAKECPVDALVVKNPDIGFAKIAQLFAAKPKCQTGVHASAHVPESCDIATSVSIGANCVLGERVVVGDNTIVMPGTVIGDDCQLGADCLLYPNVTLYHRVRMADRVMIHSGTVIGSDGFGLVQEQGRWLKMPQIGGVLIANDVEIGANTTIDRGALADTVIEEGVKLDNLIQIAHNVHIGAHTAVAANVAIAGSTRIGKYCLIAGGAHIAGHLTICDQVIFTGLAMVMKSITEPGVYSSGTGLQANLAWRKSAVRFHQLDDIARRLKKLERECHE